MVQIRFLLLMLVFLSSIFALGAYRFLTAVPDNRYYTVLKSWQLTAPTEPPPFTAFSKRIALNAPR